MLRRRNDSVKSGVGIDNGKAQSFSRDYNVSPWDVVPAGGNERSYSRNDGSSKGDKWIERGAASQNLLRNKPPADSTGSAATRDIWGDAVEGNGEINGGGSGPIRYGVNKSQS